MKRKILFYVKKISYYNKIKENLFYVNKLKELKL